MDEIIRRYMSSLAKRRWATLSADERREAMARIRAVRDADPVKRAAVGKRLAEARAAARLKRRSS